MARLPRWNEVDEIDLINMPLHSMARIPSPASKITVDVLRVPGGWIYTRNSSEEKLPTSTFVPNTLVLPQAGD